MQTYSTTISKIQLIPEIFLPEINDFLDFLIEKKAKNISSPSNEAETDMSDYLRNLENYEDLLAQGKIAW